MKHMAFGKFAILGAFVVAGCYSYPSENINNGNYNTVQASPSFSTTTVGDSDQVLVRLVNDADNGTVTSFTVNNANAGIAVDYQGAYRPYQDAKTDTLENQTDKAQQEYYIVGKVPGTYTFTLTPTSVNTGVSATVTVVVLPHDLGNALSVHSILSGDVVTVTAPPGTKFADSSAVSIPGGTVVITSRAPDGSTISFVVTGGPSSVSNVVTVSNVIVVSSPTTQYSSIVTTDTLTLPALTTTMSLSGALASGTTVVLTGGPRAVFSPTSALSFTAGSAPIVVSRAADSSSITFLVGPGDTGSVSATLVGVRGDSALGTYTVVSTNKINVPAITNAPTTVANAAPVFGAADTVTLGAGYKFAANDTISFAGAPVFQIGLSADSTKAYFVPATPGSGALSFKHILYGPFDLSVPGSATLTVAAPATDVAAELPTTAPTLTFPSSGGTLYFGDSAPFTSSAACGNVGGSGDGCTWYKVVLTASTTFDVRLSWPAGADLGLYYGTSPDGTGGGAIADNGGQGASGEPETGTITLGAGTYYFAITYYDLAAGYTTHFAVPTIRLQVHVH
jgi:hypothetical protein